MSRKAIILDVDGTLWDSTPVVAEAWNQALKENNIDRLIITPELLKSVFGKIMTKIADEVFGFLETEERYALLDQCCEYEHRFLKETDKDLLYPFVKEGIRTWSGRCDLFIVSNCECGYIELFLEKYDLGKYIKDFECFGNTGKSKGENITLLMERNNLSDAVYVGDTAGDYEASVRAGIPFIWASYGFGRVEHPDQIITGFNQIIDIVEQEEL